MNGKMMAESVLTAVKAFVDGATAVMVKRIDAVEARIANVKDGRDGKDGEKGADGRDGVDGRMGDRGPQGEPGPQGEKGADGLSVEGPKGADGEKGEKGDKGDPGERGADGKDGRDGKDGEPGRDALEIDILPSLDPLKSYARGTYASYRGGLVKSTRKTDPLHGKSVNDCGWSVIVDGIAGFDVESVSERSFRLNVQTTSENKSALNFTLPVLLDRGVYLADKGYEIGDGVTWGGSFWICQRDTQDKPGTSDAWRLAVKKGKDGRDGEKGAKGDPGQSGAAGRNYDGTRAV